MTLRTAVIGGGTVSSAHLEGIFRKSRAEPVAICDVDESAARSIADEYGTIPRFESRRMVRLMEEIRETAGETDETAPRPLEEPIGTEEA